MGTKRTKFRGMIYIADSIVVFLYMQFVAFALNQKISVTEFHVFNSLLVFIILCLTILCNVKKEERDAFSIDNRLCVLSRLYGSSLVGANILYYELTIMKVYYGYTGLVAEKFVLISVYVFLMSVVGIFSIYEATRFPSNISVIPMMILIGIVSNTCKHNSGTVILLISLVGLLAYISITVSKMVVIFRMKKK